MTNTGEKRQVACVDMQRNYNALIEAMRFLGEISAKVYGLPDADGIYNAVLEEFAKSDKFSCTILLLTEDKNHLLLKGVSVVSGKIAAAEKAVGIRRENFPIDLSKAHTYARVIRQGEIIASDAVSVMKEIFPEALGKFVPAVAKILGFEEKRSLMLPITIYSEITGVMGITPPEMFDDFIPSARTFSRQISSALEIAQANAKRKRTEEALRGSETRLSTFINAAADSFYLLDSNLNFIEINNRGLEIIGRKREDVIGKNIDDIVPDVHQSGRRKKHCEVIRTGKPYIIDHFIPHPVFGKLHFVLKSFKVGNGLGVIAHEITERVIAEESLRVSEEQYRDLVEHIRDVIFSVNTEGSLEYISPQIRAFGYEPREMIGKKFSDFIHPEDRKKIAETFAIALSGKEQSGFVVFRALTKDGNCIWMEESGKLQRNSAGDIIRLRGIIRDISERKKMETELLASEERFRNLSSMAEEGIMIHDKGIILDANQAFAGMIGHASPLEIIGKSGLEIIPFTPDSKKRVLDSITRNYEEKFDIEFAMEDGSIVPFETSGRRITYHGIPARIVFMRNIAGRKQTENALRDSEARFRSIAENINDALIVHDFRGTILDVNENACRLTGYAREELVSASLSKIERPVAAGQRPGRMNELKETGMILFEGELVNKSGQTIPVQISARVVSREGNGTVYGFVRDITEIQAQKKALDNLQKLESLAILAGGIAHDFNNVLGGVYGYLDMAAGETNKKTVAGYLSKALASIDRARGLTRQLLTFAKGGAPIKKVESLVSFIEDATKFALSGSKIGCVFSIPADLWVCEFDRNQIGQVIDNIVINAQQAMPDGGTIRVSAENTLMAEMTHPLLPAGKYVKISFADEGIGMPREILTRIFDPFYTTKPKGHGLGLATCHSIVKRHGGCIDVDSEPGKGSTFHVFLPAAPDSAADETVASALTHQGTGTILVMDDEKYMLEITSAMLQSLGYGTICVKTGSEALKQFAKAIASRKKNFRNAF